MVIVRYLLGLKDYDLDKVQGYLEEGIDKANKYFTSPSINKVNTIRFIKPNKVEMEVDCESEKKYDNHVLRMAVDHMFKEFGDKYKDSASNIRKKDPSELENLRKLLSKVSGEREHPGES